MTGSRFAMSSARSDEAKVAVSPLKTLGEFAGSQIAVVTPVLFTLLVIGIWRVGRAGLGRPADDASLFLFCASVSLLLVCLLVSLWTKVQANWAAPTYIGCSYCCSSLAVRILSKRHTLPSNVGRSEASSLRLC